MIEVRDVRQIKGDYFRRRFSDDELDLIIWYLPNQTLPDLSFNTIKVEGKKQYDGLQIRVILITALMLENKVPWPIELRF